MSNKANFPAGRAVGSALVVLHMCQDSPAGTGDDSPPFQRWVRMPEPPKPHRGERKPPRPLAHSLVPDGTALVCGPGSPAINRWAMDFRPAGLVRPTWDNQNHSVRPRCVEQRGQCPPYKMAARQLVRNKANGGPGAGDCGLGIADCGLNSRSKRIKQTHFRGAGGGRTPQEQLCETKPILRDMGKACLRKRRHGTQFTESRSCETKPIGWELDER